MLLLWVVICIFCYKWFIEIKIFFVEILNFLFEEECDYIILLVSENELFKSVVKGGFIESDIWKYDLKCEFCKVKLIMWIDFFGIFCIGLEIEYNEGLCGK